MAMQNNPDSHESIDFEIQFYEGIIKRNPNFIEALAALGDLYTKMGWYEKGLEMDMKLFKFKPNDPVILYNLACSYSLLSNLDLAFLMIKKAIKYGYRNFEHIEYDQDLLNLKRDKRFRRYFERITKRLASQSKRQTS